MTIGDPSRTEYNQRNKEQKSSYLPIPTATRMITLIYYVAERHQAANKQDVEKQENSGMPGFVSKQQRRDRRKEQVKERSEEIEKANQYDEPAYLWSKEPVPAIGGITNAKRLAYKQLVEKGRDNVGNCSTEARTEK